MDFFRHSCLGEFGNYCPLNSRPPVSSASDQCTPGQAWSRREETGAPVVVHLAESDLEGAPKTSAAGGMLAVLGMHQALS